MYLFIEIWSKEDELKALKAQLLELEHKIAADLAPKHEQPKQAEDVEQDTPQHKPVKVVEPPGQATDDKKSMVAEPIEIYHPSQLRTQSFTRF